MKADIRNIYEVSDTHEFSADWNGYNFIIIYGRHVNGWFIAIPDLKISVEAAHPTDTFYNTEKLSAVTDIPGAPEALADAVREHWKIMEEGYV